MASFRERYDALYREMNKARVRNGYEPVNYRQGYFPHFQEKKNDSILTQLGRALGIEMETMALPTSINGLTHTFKPGIQWFGHAQQRKGFQTKYDAVEGFDRYIEGIADVIYQTDNIQRLRALASQIRYQTTDEGTRKWVDSIRADNTKTDTDKDLRIQQIYDKARYTLSNFVVELEEYTNLLANKKSRADRNMEQAIGRDAYILVKNLESRVAANMVAINPGSWLTNFIPITQGMAGIDTQYLVKGIRETLKAMKKDDGMTEASTFLTNRRGSDPVVRTWEQEWSGKLSKPMEYIDTITANSLVRSRYLQNKGRGMSDQAAMDEADQWTAGVMADRSKGSMPTLFNRSNPLTKLFTQFQLEVNNQLSYVFKDIPREAKEKGLAALAAMLFKFCIGAFLYNQVYEYFVGRRPALDPIGILVDTAEDIIDGEGAYDVAANLTTNIVEELPFVGGILGGGRIPIESAIPDIENLGKALFGTSTEDGNGWSAKKRIYTALNELAKPLLYLTIPFGGGQIKKMWEGAATVLQRGSYTMDADGNKKLQYPVYADDPWEALRSSFQAMVFGKSSLGEGKEWIEGGFGAMSAKQTAVYQDLMENGVSGHDAYSILAELSNAEETDELSTAEVKRGILKDSGISAGGKAIVYYGLLATDTERHVMDALADAGSDQGAAAQLMMEIRDAAGTEEQSSTEVKLSILKEADISDTEKAVVFHGLIASKKEAGLMETMEANGADSGTVAKVLMDMRGAAGGYEKAEMLERSALTEDQKAEIFAEMVTDTRQDTIQQFEEAGLSFDDFLSAYGKYEDWVLDGMDPDLAEGFYEELEQTEPEDGETTLSDVQKWRACVDFSDDAEDQLAVLSAVMDDPQMLKVEIAYSFGVTPDSYVTLQEIKPRFDADGNGSYKNAEIQAAVDALPGIYTTEQRAVLWQLATGSTSARNNPYSREVGQKVLNAKQEAKENAAAQTESDSEDDFGQALLDQLLGRG